MPELGAGQGAGPQPVVPHARALPSGLPRGTVRDIVLHPDPRLRDCCRPAGELTFAPLRALVADLFETMYAANGRGLAAPQIGEPRRVFVMDEGWKRGEPAPLAVIEPQLVWRSRKTSVAAEECLSIPGTPVQMRRAVAVRLACFDLSGVAQELELDGTAARIAQHELDHLHGVLIVDPVAAPKAGRSRASSTQPVRSQPARKPRA